MVNETDLFFKFLKKMEIGLRNKKPITSSFNQLFQNFSKHYSQ